MKVNQVYTLLNTVTTEITGKSDLVLEDLSNVVDVGAEILQTGADAMDNYIRKLIDHIGKMVFVDRKYSGGAPSVLMDGWEFGAILQKVSLDKLPEAEENESWNLTDGDTYDVNIFYGTSVSSKFYNKRVTFEIPMSFTERQVKSAFSNASQMNAFFSMIYTGIENSMTVKLDALIMRTINNMTALTLNVAGDNARKVNLYAEYKKEHPDTTLTAQSAIHDPEFLRFCTYKIGLVKDRLSKISTLYNIGKKERFTPSDKLHCVMLSEFAKSADVYLQSDVYHNDLTKLPNGIETVPYWQGSGNAYEFSSTSKIHITATDGTTTEQSGILAVMFDRDALGVTNMDRRVTSNYNAKAEFYNNWYKYDAGYFNDTNENFVVFYVDEPAALRTARTVKK